MLKWIGGIVAVVVVIAVIAAIAGSGGDNRSSSRSSTTSTTRSTNTQADRARAYGTAMSPRLDAWLAANDRLLATAELSSCS